MLKNLIGGPATGGNFFDRVEVIARLWRRLDTDNVLLLAPRRVGKTSLLRKMQDDAEGEGYHACYFSVSDLCTEKAFVEGLLGVVLDHPDGTKAVKDLVDGPLSGMLRRVKKMSLAGFSLEIEPKGADAWRQIGESLARALADLPGRWLMMVDELPLFVLSLLKETDGRARTRVFLNWLREIRLDTRLKDDIRWILCGSIGLDTVTRRERMGDAINDLALAQLGAFADETADAFLEALGESYGIPLSQEVRQRIAERIGWLIPHHLQLLFGELLERQDGPAAITPANVDTAYDTLLATTNRSYFDWWTQRLEDELEVSAARAARVLLNAVAPTDRGVSRDHLQVVLDGSADAAAALSTEGSQLTYLLDVLVGDGYLVEDGGKYRFRSPLIRDYWRRRLLP